MKELLEVLCFKKDEIESEMPRIEKAFKRLSITGADIATAKDRLHKYYDLELVGFRKIIGIYFREMVNLMLAKEEKRCLIYNTLPSFCAAIAEAAQIADKSVYVGFPQALFTLVYGGVFNKIWPVYEKAEKDALSVEAAHCGCNLTKLGIRLANLVPKPDLQISWGIYCDEASKVDDYMNAEFGIPLITVNRIQDVNFDEDDPERDIRYWAAELRNAVTKISEVIGKEIPDEMLWMPIMEGGTYLQICGEILNLVVNSDPVPISLNTLWHLYMLYVCNVSPENKERLKDALETILRETRERVERGEGYYKKGAPRIAVFFASFVDPYFNGALLRDLGLSVVLAEPFWWLPDGALMPDLGVEQELDPYRIIARSMIKATLVAPLTARAGAMKKVARLYNLSGFLGMFPYSCRPFASDALVMKDAIKKGKDIPVIVLEGDCWDTRRYSAEVLRTRLESFAEMCKIANITNVHEADTAATKA